MSSKDRKNETWPIFEKIAHRYDLINRVLSLGIDRSWRKKVSRLIENDQDITLLDIATGTGDLLLTILNNHDNISRSVGLDMSPSMLKLAEEKTFKKKFYKKTSFRIGDATQLLFSAEEWDYVTIAFGIRNTYSPLKSLQEMYRVLKPEGKVIILEFSIPENFFIKVIYLFYFRYLLPLIGGILSGKLKAYQYLNKSVEEFPHGIEFLNLMRKANFTECIQYPLTFGIATIYIAKK